MQVILIRHGQTSGNALRRYIGRTDEPLSQKGISLARAAGVDSELRTVYVTPLRRTRQTAAILFPNARQIVLDGLREMDFGDFEGRSAAEMVNDPAYRAWVEGNCLDVCPNGEGRRDFTRRVCAAFADALNAAEARGEDTAVFVIHGGTIMSVLSELARPAGEYYSYACANCAGYRCAVRREGDSWALSDVHPWDGVKHCCENDF